MGPRDHGRTGAGLQGGGRHPGPGGFAQGLVVGPQRRQGGMVPGQLCTGECPVSGGGAGQGQCQDTLSLSPTEPDLSAVRVGGGAVSTGVR